MPGRRQWRGWIAAAAALLVMAIIGVWVVRPVRERPAPAAVPTGVVQPPVPAAGPEYHRDSLVLRDGRYYLPGDPAPFNGVVTEAYPNGLRLYRCGVANGLLEGLSEGWYSNGQKQVEEPFHAGVSHGLRTKWYMSGQKLAEANIVSGRLDGVFLRWHENGTLAEEIHLRDGQPEGLSRAYGPDGHRLAEAQMKGGEVVERTTWPAGQGPAVLSSP